MKERGPISPVFNLQVCWRRTDGRPPAIDCIRTRSVAVSSYCPVVDRFVQKNPQYRDFLSAARAAHQTS
ncbi:hypothetical protein EV137_7188 [Kribbella pratensis]|uniref:Uncharacterized protein n=1 Tax=Kribbella pratensis TaxID=2512112 RepID=A0ABY2F7L6_9ACTN|nr:hypothetical protein EV137_7188 [Kribbella pratensis]